MKLVRSTAVRAAVVGLVAAALPLAGTSPTAAAEPEPGAPADPSVVAGPAADLLEEPLGGAAAVRELGTLLPVAARVNDLSARRLETVLRTDETARLATDGHLHYVEPTASELSNDPPGRAVVGAGAAPAFAEAFSLHSNPGAARTIYLDFDGAEVTGTYWNSNYGVPEGAHPGWDPSGDGPAFSAYERAAIEQVWSMVSEDYAAYDVDVTTQDPGPPASSGPAPTTPATARAR